MLTFWVGNAKMKAGDLVADRYRLLRTIGEGGMGSVWAAHHELIGRDVAIKVTGEKVSRRREIRERFLNEARAVGRVRHTNVIDVMDVGQLPDGRLYIVFELLDGRTLEEHLEKKGRLPAGDAAMILVEVCRGLEAAHAAGVVHRDLKPANIFLHRALGGGVVIKLLDFGISKTIDEEGVSLSVTQTGVVMGTPQYMSVEQARGRDDIDVRADVWSAGAILYELSTGRLAFGAPNYNAVLDKIMHDEPLPLLSWGVNEPGLQAVVSRCLAKQRSQRYQSAKEMRAALETLLPSLPVGAGGLKLQASFGMVAADPGSPDSKVPAPPDDDSPAFRAARNEPTLVAPPDSNPPTPTSVYRPAGRRPTAPSRAAEANRSDELVAVPNDSEPPDFGARRARRTRRIMALAGGIAIAVGIAIALSASGGSGEARTPVSATASSFAPASIPPAPETQTPEHAAVDTPAPSPSSEQPHPTASAAASAALPSARKPAAPHAAAAESAKAKPVTKVESAGF